MRSGSLLDAASISIFAFGALAFSVLAVYYWREWLARSARPSAFAALSLACAFAFVSGLAFQAAILYGGSKAFVTAASVVRALSTGLIPALLVHAAAGRDARRWRWLLGAIYAAALFAIGAAWLGTWAEAFDVSAVFLLAACAAGGLVLGFNKPACSQELAHRRWTAALFALLGACAVATLAGYSNAIGAAPDYLLLAWFCVSLYYLERLVFFDVLVKRGAFLALGIAAIALVSAIAGAPWTLGAALLLCWLVAPTVSSAVARAIDRYWLRRELSAGEAERQFVEDAQRATSEDDLRERASASLRRIFLCNADVRFEGGQIVHLMPRPNGLPFLSGDRKLLAAIERSLGILLENVRAREERQRLQVLAQRAELKALRAQIDPHFLFNTLSAITGLLHDRPQLAEETVERLAQVFRYTLRQSKSEWARLADEVEFATAYLQIEKARFGERLRLRVEVDESLAEVRVPAMIIQPLVENAVRHGSTAVDRLVEIRLQVMRAGDRIAIHVSDNGPGFPPGFSLASGGEGYGLRNVDERLRLHYGDAAGVGIRCLGGETCVMLRMPAAEGAGTVNDARAHR